MKKVLLVVSMLTMMLTMTACGSSTGNSAASSSSNSKASSGSAASVPSNSDSIVVYFSASGNTKKVADKIASQLKTDALAINPKEPYTAEDLNYNVDNCRANREMHDAAARPAIANDLGKIKDYKNIYIGYPIWWGAAPRIINTLLDTYDLSGKNIYLFCTSASSGVENSVKELQETYPNIHIVKGKRLSPSASDSDIAGFIK